MQKASIEQRCKGTNRAGEPCARRAGRNGWCSVHGPDAQDMRAVGQLGGRGRTRSMLGIDVADNDLRAKAKRRLEKQLDSPDERLAQAAARALYSYGPAKPPADVKTAVTGTEHKGVSIARILEIAVFDAQGVVDDELADVILRAAAKVRELQAAGKLSPNFVDVAMEDGVKRFTENIERLAARKRNDEPALHSVEVSSRPARS